MERTDTDAGNASNRRHHGGAQNRKRPLESDGSEARPSQRMPANGRDLGKRDASTLRDAAVGACSDAKKHKPVSTADGSSSVRGHPEEHEFACLQNDLAFAIQEIKRQRVEMERMNDELAAMREMKRELIKRGVIPWYSISPPNSFHPGTMCIQLDV